MRDPAPLISEAHERVRAHYGPAIGRSRYDVVTPALIIDREILIANLAYMQSRLPELRARLRGHVKNHKSPHVARLQLEHGAFGLCAATVWEAIVMVRAGADDVLIANQLVNPHKQRVAALKTDTDRLLKLSLELKEYVDKSNENVLSLEVIKKADEIEKLAKSVRDKMKGPN